MKKHYYIKNQQIKLPILTGAILFLMLDHFQASSLVHGIVWTLYGLLFLVSALLFFNQEGIDLFKDETSNLGGKKTFQERIDEVKKKNQTTN